MRLFADPSHYTHRVRFYGFPAYYKADGEDGCDIEGTNVIWDWCILHVAPLIHFVCDVCGHWLVPDYESEGWRIEVIEPLKR